MFKSSPQTPAPSPDSSSWLGAWWSHPAPHSFGLGAPAFSSSPTQAAAGAPAPSWLPVTSIIAVVSTNIYIYINFLWNLNTFWKKEPETSSHLLPLQLFESLLLSLSLQLPLSLQSELLFPLPLHLQLSCLPLSSLLLFSGLLSPPLLLPALLLKQGQPALLQLSISHLHIFLELIFKSHYTQSTHKLLR